MKTLFAAIALGSIAAPVAAESVTIEVQTEDLNLANAKGQQALEIRIRDAARKACGFDDRTPGIRGRTETTKSCYSQAMAKAYRQYAALPAMNSYGG